MEMMNPYNLHPHPKNNEFFDNMEGQKWSDFLQSVRSSGIIEPIIVSQDLTIVSGHQRVRAAKAIGLMKIAVEVRHYEDDDKILKDLIETNLMQRGIGNVNPIKTARCIAELERISGIKNGGDRKSDSHNANLKTQADLAEQLKMSQSQLSRYKKLLDLVPELQTAVEEGKVSATNASAILARLPEDEQKAIAETILRNEGRVSKHELEFYKRRVKELSEQEPKIVEVESPETLRKLKQAEQSAKGFKADYERERQRYAEQQKEVLELKEELKNVKEQTQQANFNQKLIENAAFFMSGCGRFISEYGGLVWIADHLEELPDKERAGYIKAVEAVFAWANTLRQNIRRDNE